MKKYTVELSQVQLHTLRTALVLANQACHVRAKKARARNLSGACDLMEAGDYAQMHATLKKVEDEQRDAVDAAAFVDSITPKK